MKISDLIQHFKVVQISGERDKTVTQISSSSEKAKAESVFVAIKGQKFDGHDFIDKVLEQGCEVIVSELRVPSVFLDSPVVTWIQVEDARLVLAKIASLLAGEPSKRLKIAGITGTNGKTTVSFLTHAILAKIRYRVGLIGTIKNFDGVEAFETKLTTPDAVELQHLFSRMEDQACREAVMEVSSIAVEQHRVSGSEFAVGVFTNFTQDHLDYHGSMDAYFEAKRQFFVNLSQQKTQKPRFVINQDDPYGAQLAKEFSSQVVTYTFGYSLGADFRITRSSESLKGVEFEFSFKDKLYLVRLPLIGRFNVYNALTAIVTSYALGLDLSEIIEALSDCPQVPGRLEKIGFSHDVMVFVDYAHTPDALKSVCETLRGSLEKGRLITVFGCGGDRDRSKRAPMAMAASESSDFVMVTADNPRTEPITQILADMKPGLGSAPYHTEVSRDKAIQEAINMAGPGDIVLVAGKGHEDYQIIGEAVIPFSDIEVSKKYLTIYKINLAKEAVEKEELEKEAFAKKKKFEPKDSDRKPRPFREDRA